MPRNASANPNMKKLIPAFFFIIVALSTGTIASAAAPELYAPADSVARLDSLRTEDSIRNNENIRAPLYDVA